MTWSPHPALDCLAPRPARGDGVAFDLSHMPWLDPLHLVGVAARAHQLAEHGQVRVLGPSEPEVAHYAARMRLGVLLDGMGVRHDLPVVRERDRRSELLEVHRIGSEDDVRALSELVYQKVAATDAGAARALHESVAEVAGNVRDHSRAVGFVAAQTLGTARRVRFAVCDAGVGLRATLAARGALDDRDAISMALAGTSRFADERDRGTGLPTVLALVTELEGWLLLASGTHSVTATSSRRVHRRLTFDLAGTLLQGIVRTG